MNESEKIGIMGGTFDPIHYGHLLIAQSAAEEFALNRVIFLPTGRSPHKDSGQVTSPDLRCHMVTSAIEKEPVFELSRLEADSTATNYTCHTLRLLKEINPLAHFYFIMGEDSLDDFPKWRNPQEICRLASVLVAVRNHCGTEISEKLEAVRLQFQADIHMLHAPNFSISSREIRQRIRQGKSVHYMLPEQVESFIRKHALYQTEETLYDRTNQDN